MNSLNNQIINVYGSIYIQERLQKLENEQELVDPVEKAERKKRREAALTHWKKRKRMCTDALGIV